MTDILHIDFETRSTVDLKAVGAEVYARHDDTGVWCMSYRMNDEPIATLYPETEDLPDRLMGHVADGGIVVAHNVAFEMAIWNENPNIHDLWPRLTPEQCRCTMAMAYAMSLPGDLENAATALGLSVRKDAEGRRLMLQMCRPRSVDPLTWWDDQAKVRRLIEYCEQDVAVECELWNRMVKLSEKERRIWCLDYRINKRGVYVDVRSVKAAVQLAEDAKTILDSRIANATGGAVEACTRVLDIVEWVTSKGVDCTSVAKADVVSLLADPNLPDDVREVLLLRQEAGKSSTAKFSKMLEGVDENDRLHGMFQYHGAGTGRWSGRRVQLQNLPRPKYPDNVVNAAFSYLHRPEWFDIMGLGPLDILPSMIRGMLTASPGKELVAVDFNAIESRVLAWLAGEVRKLDVFASGACPYCYVAEGIYGLPINKKDHPDERQVGKVGDLACGFQGGAGAIDAMATAYGLELSDERKEAIKTGWRERHPRTVQFWYDLEAAAFQAVKMPGTTHRVRGIAFKVNGSFLWMRLPSGRSLCYPYPRLAMKMMWWGEEKEVVSHKGVDSVSRRWCDQYTYGGKLAENATQAVARDLLAEAMLRVDEAKYPIVMHVHDELVAEVPAKDKALEHIIELATVVPEWAEGLPIAAEGWQGLRYRK